MSGWIDYNLTNGDFTNKIIYQKLEALRLAVIERYNYFGLTLPYNLYPIYTAEHLNSAWFNAFQSAITVLIPYFAVSFADHTTLTESSLLALIGDQIRYTAPTQYKIIKNDWCNQQWKMLNVMIIAKKTISGYWNGATYKTTQASTWPAIINNINIGNWNGLTIANYSMISTTGSGLYKVQFNLNGASASYTVNNTYTTPYSMDYYLLITLQGSGMYPDTSFPSFARMCLNTDIDITLNGGWHYFRMMSDVRNIVLPVGVSTNSITCIPILANLDLSNFPNSVTAYEFLTNINNVIIVSQPPFLFH